MKQTAVEWFAKELNNWRIKEFGEDSIIGIPQEVFDKAKEMEKEQSYTYDAIRTIAYNAYCLGQLDGATEGKYNLWIQHYKKKTQAKSYQDKMKKKVKQARANAKLIK